MDGGLQKQTGLSHSRPEFESSIKQQFLICNQLCDHHVMFMPHLNHSQSKSASLHSFCPANISVQLYKTVAAIFAADIKRGSVSRQACYALTSCLHEEKEMRDAGFLNCIRGHK